MTIWTLLVPNAETGAFNYDNYYPYDSALPYDSPAGTGYTTFWTVLNAN